MGGRSMGGRYRARHMSGLYKSWVKGGMAGEVDGEEDGVEGIMAETVRAIKTILMA